MHGRGALVEAATASTGRGLSAKSLDEVCRAAVGELAVDGAAVTLASQLGDRAVVGASDEDARALEYLQITVGDGPCTAATRSGGPVSSPDVTSLDEPRWPVLSPLVARTAVRAVYALPLLVGRSAVGSVNLHSRTPHGLDDLDTGAAAAAAAVVTLAVLAMRVPDPDWDDTDPSETGLPSEVPQATGMVVGALGIPAADAMARLRAVAFVEDRLLVDVARDVVAGHRPPDLGEPAHSGPHTSDTTDAREA